MQQYFIEQASTYDEAERKAREKYGEPLTILMHETVQMRGGFFNLFPREGVKITGIIPKNRGAQYRDLRLQREPVSSAQSLYSTKNAASSGALYQKENWPQSAAIPQKELWPQGAAVQQKDAWPQREAWPQKETWSQKEALDFEEEKGKILAAVNAGKENTMKEVLDYVKTIKDKLEAQGLAASREEHPTLNMIEDILILNDFMPSYRKTLLEKVRKEFSLDGLGDYDAVQDKVLEWIGSNIKIYENSVFNVRPRIMILVGPTGVGKTTTVAKLAANYGIDERGNHKRKIVLISIDVYRIGAKEQLEKYSACMEFPFFSTADYDELKKIIRDNSDGTDLFIIDTMGKSPRDMVKLGEMKQLLDACGSLTEVHLVAAATTKASDLDELLKQFESFNYRSVIVTKMDETIRAGNVIGVLSEKAKPISYITNGQAVPTDIRKATVMQFLLNLEGFRVNRIKLEEKFPSKGQEQMQQLR